ncbi:hypothetical protein LEP1GSC050_0457 [Leptospira broomii serovar Hurstbridge str. 5399]|uniref:Uncharacterized protein n=1 Tax=Leptospira broomii serovar Hurstbridge str. 5399 TaxID=1049789 RepID=T0FEG4_9LEPT|nr:hypothetical protein LEP1GSC050_0457 [Leptospira broomii serovar Hurstbridge str. 5399]
MLIESVYTKKGSIADRVKTYSKKVIDIFLRRIRVLDFSDFQNRPAILWLKILI